MEGTIVAMDRIPSLLQDDNEHISEAPGSLLTGGWEMHDVSVPYVASGGAQANVTLDLDECGCHYVIASGASTGKTNSIVGSVVSWYAKQSQQQQSQCHVVVCCSNKYSAIQIKQDFARALASCREKSLSTALVVEVDSPYKSPYTTLHQASAGIIITSCESLPRVDLAPRECIVCVVLEDVDAIMQTITRPDVPDSAARILDGFITRASVIISTVTSSVGVADVTATVINEWSVDKRIVCYANQHSLGYKDRLTMPFNDLKERMERCAVRKSLGRDNSDAPILVIGDYASLVWARSTMIKAASKGLGACFSVSCALRTVMVTKERFDKPPGIKAARKKKNKQVLEHGKMLKFIEDPRMWALKYDVVFLGVGGLTPHNPAVPFKKVFMVSNATDRNFNDHLRTLRSCIGDNSAIRAGLTIYSFSRAQKGTLLRGSSALFVV